MVKPILDQYWLTSTYGMRDDPLGKRGRRMHKGTDLAAATGSNVYSPVDGKIAYKRVDPGGWGNYVGVIEPDGTIRQYAHLSDMSLLDVGAEVRAGDVIGLAGSTGGSTGPHVDYMMYDKEGGLHNPEVADESLYRAFGQGPRPRLDSTPRPIDPNRQVKIGTGAATGGNIFKGIKAGPAEFASAGIQSPNSGAGPLKVAVKNGLLAPEVEDPMRPVMPQPQAAPMAGQPQMAQPVSAQPMAQPVSQPLIAPQQAPVTQKPAEQSTLQKILGYASQMGAPLQQIGQGVALLEGDFESAQMLGKLVEGNKKEAKVKAKERAAVKMLTDMGYSQDQAAGIVASGNVDTLLNAAVKQKFGAGTDNRTAKMKNVEYLVKVMGIPPEQALAMEFGTGKSGKTVGLQSTNYLPGGLSQLTFEDGRTVFKLGDRVVPVEEVYEILDRETQKEIAAGGEKEAAKAKATFNAERIKEAYDTTSLISQENARYDELLRLYEADPNFDMNSWINTNLPNVSSAANRFNNIVKSLGLGVVSSTTFGALSEGELKLALAVGFPPGMSRDETMQYIREKQNAIAKLNREMIGMARHFENNGSTSEYLEKQNKIRNIRTGEIPESYFKDAENRNLNREQATRYWREHLDPSQRDRYFK